MLEIGIILEKTMARCSNNDEEVAQLYHEKVKHIGLQKWQDPLNANFYHNFDKWVLNYQPCVKVAYKETNLK